MHWIISRLTIYVHAYTKYQLSRFDTIPFWLQVDCRHQGSADRFQVCQAAQHWVVLETVLLYHFNYFSSLRTFHTIFVCKDKPVDTSNLLRFKYRAFIKLRYIEWWKSSLCMSFSLALFQWFLSIFLIEKLENEEIKDSLPGTDIPVEVTINTNAYKEMHLYSFEW